MKRVPAPTRSEIERGIARELELAGVQSAAVEARRLVAAALDQTGGGYSGGQGRGEAGGAGKGRAETVTRQAALELAKAVSRRLAGEPLQHIEGEAHFRTLRLVSDGRALIPRPETEQLVDHVSAWVKGRAERNRRPDSALEVGCGSGAVAISLLREGLARTVVALDVSPRAVSQARENARRTLGAGAASLDLRVCPRDFWTALRPGDRFDFIVSNPPYVRSSEIPELPPEIRLHEPREALDGGADGLAVIRRIVSRAGEFLAPGGALFIEIGDSQAAQALEAIDRTPGLAGGRVEKDLAGHDRFALALRPAGNGQTP